MLSIYRHPVTQPHVDAALFRSFHVRLPMGEWI